jgi:hypothetical protein
VGDDPEKSLGTSIAAATASTMPLRARAKRRVGEQLGSPATVKEGAQNIVCALQGLHWPSANVAQPDLGVGRDTGDDAAVVRKQPPAWCIVSGT